MDSTYNNTITQYPCFCVPFFLIGIVGSGVQLVPLGTAATNRPIVPAPGDYDDGEIGGIEIGRGNRSTRRKPPPVPLCQPQISHACPDANPVRRGAKSATNRLSYGTALVYLTLKGQNLLYLNHNLKSGNSKYW
jgi:hypothetical protein